MPLEKSTSKEALARNIAELHRANASKSSGEKRSNEQIAAIAYAVKREAARKKK